MSSDRKLFKGVCSECGSDCEVPFEPIEGRPIKCRSCYLKFKKKKKFKRRDFDVICAECGKDTTVPFKPVRNDPVLCRDCFDRMNDQEASRKPEVSEGS